MFIEYYFFHFQFSSSRIVYSIFIFPNVYLKHDQPIILFDLLKTMSRTKAPCIVRNNYITNRFETVYLIQFFPCRHSYIRYYWSPSKIQNTSQTNIYIFTAAEKKTLHELSNNLLILPKCGGDRRSNGTSFNERILSYPLSFASNVTKF